jgi:circadian clock protein KaiC
MFDQAGQKISTVQKASTGIAGLDAMMYGGLPRGRVTLVEGGAGAGKTVLALQSLVHAARDLNEASIFVAFEEPVAQIAVNAGSFGWVLSLAQRKKLFFLDAQPNYNVIQSGDFDLGGMLAALDAKIDQLRARRIVFDAVDVVLSMLGDSAAERRELYRLRDWILARQLTTVITSKASPGSSSENHRAFLQFLADCAVTLEHRVELGISQRSCRVLKYRGSAFNENEAPYVIGPTGMEVSWVSRTEERRPVVTDERVSSGVSRLDAMLGGGFFRSAVVLVTGTPGTAKTTLSGAFAEAACARGEPTLFVSFDSYAEEVVRNLASVGIRLDRHLGSRRRPGLLNISYARALNGSAESHLLQIQSLARSHGARCVVVDPVSALSKSGNADFAQSVARRLIDWAKSSGITLFCTSLLHDGTKDTEVSELQISTIADTWLELSYVVRAGERNRCLTIIKSRGTSHSNQVRELVLTADGVTLTDAYSVGGEPLLGTLRWEHERAEEMSEQQASRTERLDHIRFQSEEASLIAQSIALQRQIQTKQAEAKAHAEDAAARRETIALERAERRARRGADGPPVRPRKTAVA